MINPYRRYRENDVETAGPGQLIILLYDGALRFIQQGEQAMDAGDYEGAHHALVRAQVIMAELMGSLDLEQGELAGNLFRLYEYIHYELVQANIKRSPKPLEPVKDLLRGLRESWQAINRRAVMESGI